MHFHFAPRLIFELSSHFHQKPGCCNTIHSLLKLLLLLHNAVIGSVIVGKLRWVVFLMFFRWRRMLQSWISLVLACRPSFSWIHHPISLIWHISVCIRPFDPVLVSKTITLHAAELVLRFGWLQRGSCLFTESALSKLISTECGTISMQLGCASLALAYCNWCTFLFIWFWKLTQFCFLSSAATMSDNQDKTKYMPWNPSSGMSAHDWYRKERNRVAAWEKKIANARIADWKKNMQRHSFPPPFGSAPFIPPTPPAWTQQYQPSFAMLFPPINPYRPSYKPAPLANITNIHRPTPSPHLPKRSLL